MSPKDCSNPFVEAEFDYEQLKTSDSHCIGCFRYRELDRVSFVGDTEFCVDCYPKFCRKGKDQ